MKKVPQLKISFRNMSEEQSVLDIDGEIGWVNESGEWNTASNIKNQLRQLSELNTERIVVNIHSPGGLVNEGLAIHDALASHNAEIETVVFGMTASAATIIAQAGNVRKMSKNALYLVHKAWNFVIGNENDLLLALEDIRMVDDRIADIYSRRSGRERDFFLELMNEKDGRGIWLDSEKAMDHGLIDQEVEPMKAAASVSTAMFNSKFMPDLPSDSNITVEETITIKNGEQLGNLLDRAIDSAVEDGDYENRTSAKEAAANEAGIEVGTLDQILNGSINCPPRSRLEGFSRALPVTVDQQISAAENDGCEYDENRNLIGCTNKLQTEEKSASKEGAGLELLQLEQQLIEVEL